MGAAVLAYPGPWAITLYERIIDMQKGTSIILAEETFGLPAGTKISRREYSWAVEMPATWGYLSCGTTLSQAIRHALSGMPELAVSSLYAQAAVVGGRA